ncbi:MAG: anthranilate synthase component I family protein [Breznakibacter sp.]
MRRFISILHHRGLDVRMQLVLSRSDYAVWLHTAREHWSSGVGAVLGEFRHVGGFGCIEMVLNNWDNCTRQPDWWFGCISYDYKNELEPLLSTHFDGIGWPDSFFFRPRYVVIHDRRGWRVGYLSEYDDEVSVRTWLEGMRESPIADPDCSSVIEMKPRVPYNDYCRNVFRIQEHIQRGDIYEMNYCMEFYNDHAEIDPASVHRRLADVSPVPFGAFAKFDDKYLMCASPERYLCKRGHRLVSQPIKGTAPRSEDAVMDLQNRDRLAGSLKERAENTMIVDLVRNDLARVARRATVKVDELCGIYGYRQVYQMISTVSAQLGDGLDWVDAIKATFPMGSMTGAPKRRAMELIEMYEVTKRGLYSGAVGYIAPNGDFDFNVVIRSLLYNQSARYLSYMVGSAITSLSDADEEYRECLLKGKAIMQVLGGK